MVSNMDREFSTTRMEINTVVSLSMGFLKVLELIIGKMDLSIEVILSKDSEMGMECGPTHNRNNITKVTTCSIENRDTEYTTGEMATSTKAISSKTRDVDRVNSFTTIR